jgi:hypothetical protein
VIWAMGMLALFRMIDMSDFAQPFGICFAFDSIELFAG